MVNGNRVSINLGASINTDSFLIDVQPFDDSAKLVDANTIERNGGINNTNLTTTTNTIVGEYTVTDDNDNLCVDALGNVYLNNKAIGQVSTIGVSNTNSIIGANDVILTANGYVTHTLLNASIVVSEYNLTDTLLNTRTVTFTNLANILPFITSINVIRSSTYTYAGTQEWVLRLGDQLSFLSESNLAITIGRFIQSNNILGTSAIKATISIGGILYVGGVGGRLGSFDGTNWRNYNGTGTGTGGYSDGVSPLCIGTNDIQALGNLTGILYVGGVGGRMASYDGTNWKHYDGTGTGVGLASNGVIVGANNINCFGNWSNYLVVGANAGMIGCLDGVSSIAYNTARAIVAGKTYYPPIANADVVSNTAILSMCTIKEYISNNDMLAVGSTVGKIACFNGGWKDYTGAAPIPTTPNSVATWTARTSVTALNWYKTAYSPTLNLFVTVGRHATTGIILTSVDGVNWITRTIGAAAMWLVDVIWTGTKFLAVKFTGDVAKNILTSVDGINWVEEASIVFPAGVQMAGAASNGAGTIVLVQNNAVTLNNQYTIYSTNNGLTWNQGTVPYSATVYPKSINYCGGKFVIVNGGIGTNTNIIQGTNGIAWAFATTVPTTTTQGYDWVEYTNGLWLALQSTNGATITSPDCLTWTTRTTHTVLNSTAIAVVNNLFVVAYGNNTTTAIASTPDGITWTTRTTPALPVGGLGTMCYGNGIFVAQYDAAAGALSSIFYNNKNVWANQTVISTDSVNTLTTIDNRIVAGGSLGKIGSMDRNGTKYTYLAAPFLVDGTWTISNNATLIGANPISSITLFNNIVMVSGAKDSATIGYLGSFDKLNATGFKNYNGTGTGTGPYINNTPANGINSMVVSNNLLYLGYQNGFVNSMDLSYNYYPININSLTGSNNLNSVYCYKFEDNRGYVWGVVNTATNLVSYSSDPLTVSPSLLNGKYIYPEVKNGYSRVILSETPKGTGLNIQALSTMGFNSFDSTFTSTQIYPVTGLAVSATNSTTSGVQQGIVGWNYADATYKTTASTTNQYNLYGPVPMQTQGSLFQTSQGNINNLIVGYSKLSNTISVPSTVEFRLNYQSTPPAGSSGTSTFASYISAAIVDGGSSDCAGVLLTGIGEFNDSFTPQILGNNILYKYNRQYNIISLGTPRNQLQRLAPTLYKINTISPLNLYNTINRALEVSSLDYNGRVIWSFAGTASTTNNLFATMFNGTYSNSVDIGAKIVAIPTTNFTVNSAKPFGYRVPYTPNISSYFIDSYFNGSYIGSWGNDLNTYTISDPAYPIYVQTTVFPTPIGETLTNGLQSNLSRTLILNNDYDGYNIGNDISGVFNSFILFGQTYLYDTNNIYLANIQQNVLLNYTKLCSATGLQYIASTPQIIFFLSTFDNSLYTFDGGRIVQKAQRLTSLDKVSQGIYNVHDGSLVLDGTNHLIYIRDNVITQTLKLPTQTNLKLYNTTDGLIVANNSYKWKTTYYPTLTSTAIPFNWQSGYLGVKLNEKSILSEFDITIFDVNKNNISFDATTYSYDDNKSYADKVTFKVSAKDYNNLGAAHVRVQPKVNKSVGISLGITSNDTLFVTSIDAVYNKAEAVGIRNSR